MLAEVAEVFFLRAAAALLDNSPSLTYLSLAVRRERQPQPIVRNRGRSDVLVAASLR